MKASEAHHAAGGARHLREPRAATDDCRRLVYYAFDGEDEGAGGAA